MFLVGATAADLAALRDRISREPSIEVAGAALRSEVQSGAVRVPAGVDSLMLSPQALAPAVSPPAAGEEEPLIEQLTPRERAVLALVADGLGNREIGRELDISEHTVKFHLASIFGKLGASSRTEAVRRGLRLGLIEI